MRVRISDSMAWPALLWLHGLGFFLLFGLTLGFGRRKEYAIALVSLALIWTALVVIRKWRQGYLPNGVLLLDWLFLAFVALIGFSFTLQGWDKSWVQANARFVPFYMIAPYLCGRLMLERDLGLFARNLFYFFGVSLLIFLLAFQFSEESYFYYRPQVFGSDEITARIASLIAQVGVVVVFILLRDFGTTTTRRIWGYFLLFGGLAALLVFLGLRSLLLSSCCVVALVCFKAKWLTSQRRLAVAIYFLIVVAGAMALMYQTSSLAKKNGKEVVRVFGALAESDSLEVMAESDSLEVMAENGVLDDCIANAKKINSVAIRLELFRDAIHLLQSSPLMGGGAGAFGQHSCWSNTISYPHNILLHIASELGVIGVSIFLVMALFASIPQLRIPWGSRGDMSNLAFLFFLLASINSLFSGNYFTSGDFWWSLGLLGAMNSQVDRIRARAAAHPL